MKNKHLYSLMKNGKVLVSLSVIDTAREGLEYFGGTTYIKFHQPGIETYEDAKRYEEIHHGEKRNYHDS